MIADSGQRWDIFCKIVDNFGDAGVCWRLARQLVNEYGVRVRLWCDQLAVLGRLVPELDIASPAQRIAGVEVCLWPATEFAADPGDVVIEAFACELPASYIAAMAAKARAPIWINLEYLSAEPWVAEFHGRPSPHPRLPLMKYFFFPGFTAETGGLLRERDLMQRRSTLLAEPAAAWAALEVRPPLPGELNVSLFCYENPALPQLLTAWARSSTPVRCLLRPGRSLAQLASIIDRPAFAVGETWQRDHLTVTALPYCRQEEFDHLLWLCQLNFVRGEDSLVRALWAGRPLVWHIYPQSDEVHMHKLEAFLDVYVSGLPASAAAAYRDFCLTWNRGGGVNWDEFLLHLDAFAVHAERRAALQAQYHDLAKNLAEFVESRLKLQV